MGNKENQVKHNNDSNMIETHPYKPFVDNNSKLLIIGTTPPMRFTQKLELYIDDVDFYYGSRDNYFWDLIGDVFGLNFEIKNSEEAINQRKDFLTKYRIGLVDIVLKFSRNEKNASDSNLNVQEFQNIYKILIENPQIEKVFFTGYSGSNSAESLTSTHLGEHKVYNTVLSTKTPRHKFFKINNREIHSFSLYSPSPAARKRYEDMLSLYQILKND
jgi:G:T/U-mismatch repair DNA glycosylase